MCDYCGCQALHAIAELTKEHDLVVNLAGEAARALRAGELDVAAERSRSIGEVLGPHTAVEEGALFPAMAAEFGEHVADLLHEHRVIEAVLAESATSTPTDPGWPARLTDVLRLLREHILKEQDGVFPAALAALDSDQWDAVEAIRADVGASYAATIS